ncbi:MAG TPA: T9SS type A sorting domain-containing protein, partial [Niastella sp.]
ASIYFDFNKPVKTNEQLTVVRATPVAKPSVSGMQSTYCSNLGLQKGKLTNNPATGRNINVSVRLDAVSLPVAADSTFSFAVASLSTSSHRLSVTYTDASSADSVVYIFTVATAATPDVNVNSNISTVSNLSDDVVINAVNAAGGGANPLYTFAKDRAITSILQAESAANTLTIQPNTLSVGSNWIYVRMKSSATCYTVQANIDSIKIERATVTGITDVDYPNQVIKIYPNPFSRIISITGLNTGKAYTIIINNPKGQQVYSHQVKNVNSYTVNKQGLLSGQYWLSIYDNSKKRLIGTVPLIKE